MCAVMYEYMFTELALCLRTGSSSPGDERGSVIYHPIPIRPHCSSSIAQQLAAAAAAAGGLSREHYGNGSAGGRQNANQNAFMSPSHMSPTERDRDCKPSQGATCSCPLGGSAARPEPQQQLRSGVCAGANGNANGKAAGGLPGLGLGLGALGMPGGVSPFAGLLPASPNLNANMNMNLNLQSAEALQQAYQQVALVYSQYLAMLSSQSQQQSQQSPVTSAAAAAAAASSAGTLPALAALSTALSQNPALAYGHLAQFAPQFASAAQAAAALDGEPDHKRVKLCHS